MKLEIHAIPAFTDNYIWALIRGENCVLVDPGDAAGPLEFLTRRGLKLAGLLLTHHHVDHVGGVETIRSRHPAPAWGPEDSRMPADIEVVAEGDHVEINALGMKFSVLETPGHTTSHIIFHDDRHLLCGDTLFSSGCGRLFEGTPEQMQDSLDKLCALPDSLGVYCAHEYTRANCRFALEVEPDNPALIKRARQVDELRRADRITLPTTLGEEKTFNPFLRTREPTVIHAAQQREPGTGSHPAEVFGVIRRWKDGF